MKNIIVLCLILVAIFCPTSSFAKPKKEIIAVNGLVVVRVTEKTNNKLHVKAYVYFVREGVGDFGILRGTEENFETIQASLDKNNKPQAIIKVRVTGTKHKVTKYPKSDKNNTALYQEMEKEVATFIKEHDVKKVVEKYKNKSPAGPLPEIPQK